MPEGYTHLRIAAKAAAAMRHKLKWPAAFAAGANGPDIFFCYEAWRPAKKRRYDLPALGQRLHEDDTGAFLLSLVRGTHTGPQAEYTLGFLSHYAADTVLHPYIAAVSAPGMPYAGPGGHGYFEIALDSALHKEDTGDAVVPAAEACPTPAGEALAEVTALLRGALQRTYGLDIPAEYIADSFFYSTRLRGLFTSRFGVRRALFWLIEPLFGGRGRITVHVSPRRLKDGLPDTWIDPATGEEKTGDVFELMARAQERSRQYMAAAVEVWSGRQPIETLAALLGSVSYTTGTATARSGPGFVPPASPAETPAPETPPEEEPETGESVSADETPAGEAPPAGETAEDGTPAGEAAEPAEAMAAALTDEEPPAEEPLALSAEQHEALLAEGLALITAAQAEKPPADGEPPAEEPPAETEPPASEPAVEEPPASEPAVEEPPAGQAAENAPAAETAAEPNKSDTTETEKGE